MKKLISKLLALALAGSIMVGCASGTTSTTTTATTDSESLSVVTTIFPIYDWTKVILGEDLENVTLTYLENTGVDVHSFEPTVSDMALMATCDMFIYVGGESDDWVDAVLANAENPDMVVINLLDVLGDGVMEEAEVEGMQEHDHDHDDEESEEEHDHDHDDEEVTEEEHDHDDEEVTEEEHDHDHDDEEVTEEDHDHDEECTDEDCEEDHDHDEECTDEDCEEDHDHDEECTDEDCEEDHDHDEECEDEDCDHDHEFDEHVWLSLNNAAVICQVIANELAALNPAQADLYAANVADYLAALTALDAEYQAVVADAAQTTLLFVDRFPFQYMMEDYGLSYYAAFSGCTTDTEATFETISFLATKIDELGLTVILTTEDPVANLAETVINATSSKGQTVLQLDSMQAVIQSEVDAGASYLSIMESNLEILAEAVQ